METPEPYVNVRIARKKSDNNFGGADVEVMACQVPIGASKELIAQIIATADDVIGAARELVLSKFKQELNK